MAKKIVRSEKKDSILMKRGGIIMHELTKLIYEDMKPALGVTEPGAIAYAVAKAASYIKGEPEKRQNSFWRKRNPGARRRKI